MRAPNKILILTFLITGIFNIFFHSNLFAQAGCGAAVPTFTVNLTGNPNGSWISPVVIRNDNCCGTSNPDRCVQFIITLDPAAQGILFDIFSGAVPPGAMYYQINCNPPVAVGTPVCLSGAGPHYLTFCKPGNNQNKYIITSIGAASAKDDSVTTNCNSGKLVASNFYTPSTIWTSVYPGATGAYNSFLSCTSGCDTAFVTPVIGAPTFIDYQVCGQISTLCNSNIVCDTARIYIYAPVQLSAPGNICAGAATANVTATPTGGALPYNYLWTPTGQTTQTATGLSAGSYTVKLTDANGCISTAGITIYAVGNPVATITSTNVSCFGGSNGSATAVGSGGTSPYTYQWNNGQTAPGITGLSFGNYSVIITDIHGCNGSSPVNITQPASVLSSTVSNTNVSCFGGSNGIAAVSASGGTPAYTYLWSSGQTTSTISGLATGNYSVTITDANGCLSSSTSISVSQPSAAVAPIVSINNVSCFGGSNGSASVTLSGGTPGYTYLWSNGQGTSSITGVPAGNYSVNVNDANGCTILTPFIITQPAALTSVATQMNLCSSASNGLASVTASGGTAPYTYLWSNGQTNSLATGLSAGNYSVTTTDANNCVSSTNVTISLFPILSFTNSITNVSCFGGNNGSATVSMSGGSFPYTYQWSNGQTTQTISGLTAGSYSVTITDANGCNVSSTINITQPSNSLSTTVSQTNVLCFGANTGTASVSASGGTPAYSYLWSTGQTSATISGLVAGNYFVTTTDANGCAVTILSVAITQPSTNISSTLSQNNVTCFGSNNGSASVSASGGTPLYSYLWNTGQTTSAINNITAGNYSVTITDANGCTKTSQFIITQPASALALVLIHTNINCSGETNGSASSTVTGGTSPYNYLWSNGQNTPSISGLGIGNYTLNITDNNGCSINNANVTITQPLPLTITTTATSVSCNGGNTGSVTAMVGGGILPYNYLWNNGSTSSTVGNLSAGNYSVYITDSNSCTISSGITVSEPSPIILSLSYTPSTCFQSNGSATVVATGGTGGYTYLWNNGQTGSTSSNLSSANYLVTITDGNGCIKTGTIQVQNNPGVNAVASSFTTASCTGVCDGSATVSGIGGVPPYSYLWTNGATSTTINNLCAANYSVMVTDNTGCSSATTFYITEPGMLNTTITQNNPSCFGYSNGGAVAIASGGTSPYTYNWNTGVNTSSISNLAAGSYSIAVTDNNGCSDTTFVIITEPLPVSILTNTLQNVSCFAGANGLITVTGSGGTPNYTYLWIPNMGNSSTVNNLSAGSYQVFIQDQNSCKDSLVLSITEPADLITAALSTIPPTCNNGSNGSITATVSGGTSPYQYLWSTIPSQNSATASNLTQGNYFVYITDANNCYDTLNVNLAEPPPVIATAGAGDTICLGQSVTITAGASGGAGNYTYSWTPSISGNGSSQTVSPSATTIYTVTSQDQNNCFSASDTIKIEVINLSQANSSMFAITPICPGQNSEVSVVVSGNTGPLTYFWSNGLGTTAGPFVVTPTQPTTYTVIITNSCGTLIKDSIRIFFNPPPTVLIASDTLSGCTPVTINFNEHALTGNSNDPITSWLWNFGDGTTSTMQNPPHTFNTMGAYNVMLTVTTSQGCTNNNSVNPLLINARPKPSAAFTTSSTVLLIPVDSLICNNQSTGAIIYDWSFGDGGTSTIVNPMHTYYNTGFYNIRLIATNSFSCSDTAFLDISVIPSIRFPNAFTPDPHNMSDGYYDPYSLDNNIFFPYTAGVTEYQLLIFDRWGELIFESDDIKQGWNGYFKDKICQQDVYIYKGYAKFINGNVYRKTGDVTLIR